MKRRRQLSNVALSATAIFAIVISSYPILLINAKNGVERIKTVSVGAYWDQGCSNKISAIDWGIIEPGSTKNVIIYLKNEGNTPITLSLNTTNWSPSDASKYISISWSYAGQRIKPGKIIQMTLSLTISSDFSVSVFAFDLLIYAIF